MEDFEKSLQVADGLHGRQLSPPSSDGGFNGEKNKDGNLDKGHTVVKKEGSAANGA
jgi:hypothetical protein